MKEFVVYTLARLGLFVASYALVVGVYLLVTGGEAVPLIWPFLVAVVISAVASFYLLRGMRERFALVVEARANRASQKFEEMRAKEDGSDRT
ncbi:DUF4229 domain-containing protein [Nocardioides sp. WL0053]|uniref:DUF4229 domain-containing protein n=1 Tax=Nocardioides jiangsuensis TaxID=2866161 RepID=A0ABS7RHQ5_9ACTN|nr:DUF4229 domain-containing protein [Nocardioides jiangsuensis]MBY9074556.1 DUF4229 domain-containing protein [Nocardioides jiangsuensis]